MKNTFIKIIGMFFLVLFYQCKNVTDLNASKDKDNPFSYKVKEKSLISAHRGGSNILNYPENCIETMNYLYNEGISIFEIDLSLTKDKQIVLMHDNSLQRTTTGRQDVNQISLEQIKQYNLVDYQKNITSYKVPTFEEALKWAKDKGVYFMVDIKKSVSYKEVILHIRKENMEKHCVLIAYSLNQSKKLHQLAPEMMLSVPMRNENEFKQMMSSKIPLDKMIAFTGTKLSSKNLYEEIHNKNILVILGTLGNLDKRAEARGDMIYRDLEKLGIDIFATDRALQAQNAINKK